MSLTIAKIYGGSGYVCRTAAGEICLVDLATAPALKCEHDWLSYTFGISRTVTPITRGGFDGSPTNLSFYQYSIAPVANSSARINVALHLGPSTVRWSGTFRIEGGSGVIEARIYHACASNTIDPRGDYVIEGYNVNTPNPYNSIYNYVVEGTYIRLASA